MTTRSSAQSRFRGEGSLVLIHGERGTRGGAMVQTMAASGHDPAGAVPALTFSRYENQLRLSGVWPSNSDGRTVGGR